MELRRHVFFGPVAAVFQIRGRGFWSAWLSGGLWGVSGGPLGTSWGPLVRSRRQLCGVLDVTVGCDIFVLQVLYYVVLHTGSRVRQHVHTVLGTPRNLA